MKPSTVEIKPVSVGAIQAHGIKIIPDDCPRCECSDAIEITQCQDLPRKRYLCADCG
jgi:transposase-like protein